MPAEIFCLVIDNEKTNEKIEHGCRQKLVFTFQDQLHRFVVVAVLAIRLVHGAVEFFDCGGFQFVPVTAEEEVESEGNPSGETHEDKND